MANPQGGTVSGVYYDAQATAEQLAMAKRALMTPQQVAAKLPEAAVREMAGSVAEAMATPNRPIAFICSASLISFAPSCAPWPEPACGF